MFKFFNNIRHDLLNKGETVKYLRYAIGEIVLVVIGILIALSIDNWNDNRHDREAEKNYYRNLRQELQDDRRNIEGQIMFNAAYAAQYQYGMELINLNDRSQKDSLSTIAVNLVNYSDFDRRGNIYETTVNSGDIKLLRNDEIIERLRQLEETYLYINRMENIHYDIVMMTAPGLMDSIRFITEKADNEDFLYSPKCQNMFFISLRVMEEKDAVYHRGIEEIDTLLNLIEAELQ